KNSHCLIRQRGTVGGAPGKDAKQRCTIFSILPPVFALPVFSVGHMECHKQGRACHKDQLESPESGVGDGEVVVVADIVATGLAGVATFSQATRKTKSLKIKTIASQIRPNAVEYLFTPLTRPSRKAQFMVLSLIGGEWTDTSSTVFTVFPPRPAGCSSLHSNGRGPAELNSAEPCDSGVSPLRPHALNHSRGACLCHPLHQTTARRTVTLTRPIQQHPNHSRPSPILIIILLLLAVPGICDYADVRPGRRCAVPQP
ncbi:hypothetical protein INR49_023786, partial [Caranx melampygus]